MLWALLLIAPDARAFDTPTVIQEGPHVAVTWPAGDQQTGHLVLDTRPGKRLVSSLGLGDTVLLRDVEPVVFVTVGTRQAPSGRPPQMSIWNTFFDKPASRPHRTFAAERSGSAARVTTAGNRATVHVSGLTVGPFKGEWQLTVYAGCPLVHVEAVVTTEEDRRAILYDAGLAGADTGWHTVAWRDTRGQMQQAEVGGSDQALAVRHRALVAECAGGSVACFPPPHQFHFPRDWTDNFRFAWAGRGHHGHKDFGFGVRQVADGGRAFEPWFNAPPGTRQRLGVFYLLARGRAEDTLAQVLRYTRGDRFEPLPGHITFTSHYHMAVAVSAMARKFQGVPDFVRVFKEMGVQAVHLGDFHGDGHQKDSGPLRLPELAALFRECRRLSDAGFLLIPGEEVNDFLGIREPGKHPGHWMSLFPKPVYWIMQRVEGQPFAEQHPEYGTVYRIGNQKDMMELLVRERGLAWAAHPRIKASSWTPDIFRREPFYLADYWLGGAWKAMPADLSRERLGERCLDLLDDMANWGQRKYLPGEVDVFKIDTTHELFGHMNINYMRLDRLPRYEDGWQPILDALRAGRFFVTTGEVLLREFTVGGRQSGETLRLPPDGRPELRLALDWTFPLRFVEVISGDGTRVHRERQELTQTSAFGQQMLTLKPDLRGRKWVRVEAWDVAANGAFTQPVWLE